MYPIGLFRQEHRWAAKTKVGDFLCVEVGLLLNLAHCHTFRHSSGSRLSGSRHDMAYPVSPVCRSLNSFSNYFLTYLAEQYSTISSVSALGIF